MSETTNRKADHVRICLEEDVERKGTGLEWVRLIHNALPEIDWDDIDTSAEVLGKRLDFPLVISAMTGGYPGATELNRLLAKAAEERGIAMGLGSMRAMIEDGSLDETYAVRDVAPKTLLLGNIGIPQVTSLDFESVFDVMERAQVDAVAIHLNALQEATQREGEPIFSGALEAIRRFCSESRWPVIVKETGGGISRETATALVGVGVRWIDVAGFGGTSFAAVEAYRSQSRLGKALAESLGGWGVPTAASIVEAASVGKARILASGGIRNGIDVAKCLALGATAAGMASPLLKASVKGEGALNEALDLVEKQTRAAMFLTGSRTVRELQSVNLIVEGWLRDWLVDRGLDPAALSKRHH